MLNLKYKFKIVEDKNQKIKGFVAVFLWILFVTPTLVNLIHHCDSHGHLECKEIKAHLHQLQTDCEVCDYNILTFDYKINKVPILENNEIFVILDNFFVATYFHSFSFKNTKLRAPPIFS